ncbi:hypothetical protein AK830_g9315 [Neonectria ditissima]|uniref:4-coumarate--CoA ligase-like 7 n=1 Tax=Neonectria ditissima TaxID=78410 RepID=A0A0N8H5V6_9HYPO|nr:hypothetical protein AK830_g9315 [Neonectria ditissima]
MSAEPSYVGTTASVPGANTFDWLFGNPFELESDYVPPQHRIPHIDDNAPIFVDHATDRALTFSRLRNDALALAGGLHALGLDPEDIRSLPPTPSCPRPEVSPVVLVQLPNCLPFATAVFGTLAAGLTVTLVSPGLTATELAWVVKNSQPHVIITAKSSLETVQQALKAQEDTAYVREAHVFTVDVARDPYPMGQADTAEADWRRLISPDRALQTAHALAPEAAVTRTAVILWSSGTSGRSKGVLLSHNALNFSVASLWHDADFYGGRHQRWLGYVPFYHVFGLSNSFLIAVCTGATVYTMPGFKLDAVLSAIPRRQITYLHMAPPVAVMLAKSAVVEPYLRRDAHGRNAFSSVVAGVTGGAPLGHEIVVQVHARLGFLVRMGYGMSEACSVTVQSGTDEAAMRGYKNDTGRPHWGVELMIAGSDGVADVAHASDSKGPKAVLSKDPSQDPSQDPSRDSASKAAPFGTPGEILIRSPALMSAYIPSHGLYSTSQPDMSVTTEALTHDGWLRTGDVGTLDPDGTLCITDRIKELIKVRAYQVAPAELEALLCSSDDVADAGVVGVHDKTEATEWPRAYVVARDPAKTEPELHALAQSLKAHVESHTARYKWLVGGIVFVEQIPKSPSGKILRRVMRDGGVQGLEVALYQRKQRSEHKPKL